jgi:hypothetical protein
MVLSRDLTAEKGGGASFVAAISIMNWRLKLAALLFLFDCRATDGLQPPPISFFPETFPDTDIGQYTVRYVSPNGQDREDCLQNQTYPPPPLDGNCEQPPDRIAAASHCRSIGYSLLENCTGLYVIDTELPFVYDYPNCTPEVTSNLIVLFYPETYGYHDDLSVILINYTNLVIRKVPVCEDSPSAEVVFSCTRFTDNLYNNLYIISVVNLAVNGVVFSRCGPYSPGAAMIDATNVTFTDCEFR